MRSICSNKQVKKWIKGIYTSFKNYVNTTTLQLNKAFKVLKYISFLIFFVTIIEYICSNKEWLCP